ncbi:hypothetical protein EXIGLDRAFT_730675, partial [Exidia glandulosa HHB12029]
MATSYTAKFSLISSDWPARSSHSLGVLAPSHALVFGGELEPRKPVPAAAHALPLLPGKPLELESTGTVPIPRVGAVLLPDPTAESSFWLWGGRGGKDMAPLEGDDAGPYFVRFADAQAQWERVSAKGDAPLGRSYHCGAVLGDNLYIHAGCPVSGRLGDLYSLNVTTRTWARAADAPGAPRGGTVLAATKVQVDGAEQDALLRWGGFAGYEIGADNDLDVYLPSTNSWRTVKPAAPDGAPGARSVHGFTPLQIVGDNETLVAVMFLGERDPSSLGHEGAGAFWEDVWGLFQSKDTDAETLGLSWRQIELDASASPEPRGWFAFTDVPVAPSERSSVGRVLMHGGLLSSNKRSSEAWLLEVRKAS